MDNKFYIDKSKQKLKYWLLNKTDSGAFYFYFIDELLCEILNFINSNNLKLNQGENEVLMHFVKFLYVNSVAE